MRNKKIIAIFSGYNPRAVIAFIRTLIQCDVDFVLIAKSVDDDILLSEYANRVIAIRNSEKLDFEDIIRCVNAIPNKDCYDKIFIAPSSEALNRFFLRYRNEFANFRVEIPLVDENLYNLVSDKYSFSRLCSSNKIAVPAEFETIDNTTIPFVAKPKKYADDKNGIYSPILIYDQKGKDDFLKLYPVDSFYFQEFVEGESYYLLYYFDQVQKVTAFSQRNIAQQPGGKSIIAAIPATVHLEPVSSQFVQMLKSIGFRGLIMIEIIKKKSEYYMIEANPRFWGPSQLFVDNGINLFKCLLFDYGFPIDPTISSKANNINYYWEGGQSIVEKKGESIVVHSPNIYYDSQNKWDANEIYKRSDTINIYLKENANE